MTPTDFMPEVTHARIDFHKVKVSESSAFVGDGWDCYGRTFRTIEDVYVSASMLGYVLREARLRRWPAAYIDRLVAALALFEALSLRSPLNASLHVALAGALHHAYSLFYEATTYWESELDGPEKRRWFRDMPILDVAQGAREARLAKAHANFRLA